MQQLGLGVFQYCGMVLESPGVATEGDDSKSTNIKKDKAMIELIKNIPENVVGFFASGQVTASDHEKILIPEVE